MSATRPCPLCDSAAHATPFGSVEGFTCPNCSLVHLGDAEAPDGWYTDYWARLRSDAEDPAVQLRSRQYELDARHLIDACDGRRVLDVGCSSGGFLAALDALDDFGRLVGVDPDRSALAVARPREWRAHASFHEGDLVTCGPLDGPFDAIVFRGTLQYVGPTLREVLRRADELLAPGGCVVLYAIPNADSFLLHLLQDRWHLFHPFEHRLIFGRASVQAMATRMGWRVEEVSYPYLETPYASPEADYARVLDIARGGEPGPVAFWGNVIQAVLRKAS